MFAATSQLELSPGTRSRLPATDFCGGQLRDACRFDEIEWRLAHAIGNLKGWRKGWRNVSRFQLRGGRSGRILNLRPLVPNELCCQPNSISLVRPHYAP